MGPSEQPPLPIEEPAIDPMGLDSNSHLPESAAKDARDDRSSLAPIAPESAPDWSAVIEQLQIFQRSQLDQLAQDLDRLSAEKTQLLLDLDRLARYRQQLRAQPAPGQSLLDPTSQAWAQQWAKQLAQHMGSHLKRAIDQRFQTLAQELRSGDAAAIGTPVVIHGRLSSTAIERQLMALDQTLAQVFTHLRQDLAAYEQALAQRLSRLARRQQQGELLLKQVMARWETSIALNSLAPDSLGSELGVPEPESTAPDRPASPIAPLSDPAPVLFPPPLVAVKPSVPHPQTLRQPGWLLALVAALLLALFNVALKLLFTGNAPETLLGVVTLPGIIAPGLGNSLLILLLRTLAIVLVFPVLATWLYPATWQEIRHLCQSRDRRAWQMILLNGFFMFVSQVLLYVAIGNLPTGLAVTLFFLYPVFTLPLSWWLLGDRPTALRLFLTALILLGGGLALPEGGPAAGDNWVGLSSGLAAGAAFAGYLLTVQWGTKTLHPVPFTLVSFLWVFVLACFGLIARPETVTVQVLSGTWGGLLLGGVILGLLTLGGYLLNNLAVQRVGAAWTAILSASGNALTALAAWILIQESLAGGQWLGIGLVTLGVTLLSVEQLSKPRRSPRSRQSSPN
ncbi:MAG: hypothetical protein BJG00_008170 [Limnothrix sp. CACIAM 69d]|nr:MAG: hypothetical protein BJG00_008170 [Limnothrix sp. CACIAM 69d]